MPYTKEQEYPQPGDHVLLDEDIEFKADAGGPWALVIPKGAGGMVREVKDSLVTVDFGDIRARLQMGGHLFLTLYRRPKEGA